MNKILALLCFVLGVVVFLVAFPQSGGALLVLGIASVAAIALLRNSDEDNEFLVNIFIIGLLLRVTLATAIYVLELQDYLGPDALGYDALGSRLSDVWLGNVSESELLSSFTARATMTSGPGWGMNYVVAFIYSIVGRNPLAGQFFCAVVGASIAPMVYYYAQRIFENRRVGKTAAVIVAVFPAFIIWTSQLLKDSLVIFLLVLAMLSVAQLQQKFSYKFVGLLVFCLFGLVTIRFYIAYMVAVAVFGSFMVGQTTSLQSIVRRVVILAVMAGGLGYLGLYRTAGDDIEKYGSLERVQISRQYLSDTGDSGYASGDVSTTQGAIFTLPIGFTYLMFAPFPWEIKNIRQLLVLPEVIVWWIMIPLAASGIWYTLKNRLRGAMGILLFTILLTIGYSLFQGNVGTAYRQRTQIQVFLFVFVGVGWTLVQEKRENRKALRLEKLNSIQNRLRQKREESTV